jgi:peptidoglycan/LPS O-acetylase OafA/YrhL
MTTIAERSADITEGQTLHFNPSKNHRFLLLDAMRGIAAVLVARYHAPLALQSVMRFPNAYMAVDLFFCLSGFVIAFSYEQRLREHLSTKSFFIARLIRLYPLYILGSVIGIPNMLGRFYFSPHTSHSLGALLLSVVPAPFMLPNLLSLQVTNQTFPLNLPAWSLFFELVANMAYALLIRHTRAQTAVIAAIPLLCFPILLRHVLVTAADLQGSFSVGWDSPTFLLGFARVGLSFFIGVLLFRFYRHNKVRLHGPSAVVIAIASVLVLLVLLGGHLRRMDGGLVPLMVATFALPVIIYLGAIVHVAPAWKGLCTFLGDFSYPLYALHSPAMFLLYIVQVRHLAMGGYAQLLPLPYICLLIPATWWVGKHYDAPLRKFLIAKSQNLTPQGVQNAN